MYAGLVLLGELLKITQITAAQFLAFITAFKKADDDFNAARSAEQDWSRLYQAAVAALDEYLVAVKGALIIAFGNGYSTQWVQAGFINNSTQIPSTIAGRLALTGRLVAFFTKNPNREVPNGKVTAAEGAALEAAVGQAQQKLTTATRELKDLGTTWDNAFKALGDEEWKLIKLLQATLNDDDTRWLAFGLPMPSQNTTPGQPTGLSAQLDENGAILVQCEATALTTRYRFRMMILGVDDQYSLAVSSPIPMGTIKGVQPGQTVQLIVQAANGNQQGVASEPIQFTVPLVRKGAHGAADTAAATVPALEEVTGSRNGNGSNANGRSNGHRSRARVS